MLEKLTKDPKKVPVPDRGEMMSLLVKSEKAVELDANTAFNQFGLQTVLMDLKTILLMIKFSLLLEIV